MTPEERAAKRPINLPVAFLSLFTSTVLWFVVFVNKLPADVPKVLYVPLSVSGLDTGSYVVTKKEDRMQVVLRGPDNRVRDFSNRDIEAVADLSRAVVGTRRYPVTLFTQNAAAQRVLNNEEYSTLVEVERLSSKEFPVSVDSRGELADSTYVLTETLVEPSRVRIYGPQSMVDRVRKVRAVIDLGLVKGNSSNPAPVGLEFFDVSDRPIDGLRSEPIAVTVKPILTPAPQEKTAFVRPRFVDRPAVGFNVANYTVEPNQVTVRGPSRQVAQLYQIDTEPISLTGVTGTRSYDAVLRIPRGFTCDAKTVRVTVYVKQNPTVRPDEDALTGAANR